MAAENAIVAPPAGLPAGLKPILLLVGIAAAVAAGLTVAMWWRGPSYSLLYANLGAEDQAQIAQALDAAQIPYRISPGGNGIEVSTEHLTDARLKLAGQGLPEGGGGFALLDKDPGFGVSQFVENARYQHALETELARTIASLRPVEGARVHLAVPRQSAFVRDSHGASASVFVQLKAGRRLEQEQVQAIINLVASSIPELDAKQVTVVDQQGRLLSAPEGHDEFSMREQQFDMVHRLEDDYRQRIEALLTPLVGAGRVRAQVVAQMDMSVTEESREQYRPDSQIVRSEQTSEQTNHDGGAAGGVPGALSNQPPPAGVAAAPAGAPAPAAATATAGAGANGGKPATGAAAAAAQPPATPPPPENTSKETTRNYEMDRTLAYTRQPAGKLKRLTVAVLVDNAHTTDKSGKTQAVALTAQQIDHITQLVKDAVGFDESRGDAVNVLNASFTEEAPPPSGDLQMPAIWEKPLFWDLVKLIAGAAVLIVLVLSVLRPLVRALIGSPRAQRVLAAPAEAAQALISGAPAAAAAPVLSHEQQLAHARTLVNQDPKRVAQVVREWVGQDE
jgi:flagellar M-ring protein FliF